MRGKVSKLEKNPPAAGKCRKKRERGLFATAKMLSLLQRKGAGFANKKEEGKFQSTIKGKSGRPGKKGVTTSSVPKEGNSRKTPGKV